MWHFSTVTFRLCDNFLLWHFDHVTFFYCDIPTLWQFSTVTFCLKVGRLSVHPKKWTFCHTVTFRPTVILATPWLWHFVHFRCWFLPSIPCQSCRRFWQMTISWHYPFNFWTPHTGSGGQDLAEGMQSRCFFDYFSDPTARLEATATFRSLPRGDFDHCDILSTPRERSRKASRWVPSDLWQNVHISLHSKSGCPVTIQGKKGGRSITVTKRPPLGGGVDVSYLDVSNGCRSVAVVKCHWVHLS
jgi:hypothetical protein